MWFDGQVGAEYFDSFGVPPTLEPILRSIKRNITSCFSYNAQLFQNLLSSAWGFYVMYYKLMKSRDARLSRMRQVFHLQRLRANDLCILSLVKNMLS